MKIQGKSILVRVIGIQLYSRFLAKAGDIREARASTSLARIELHVSVLKKVKKRKTIHWKTN